MKIIGIDPSINSTGICIKDENTVKYYLIVPNITKKLSKIDNEYLKIIKYDKHDTKELSYSEKESAKLNNIYNICNIISDIIDLYKPDNINIEGVAYSANGSVIDLTGLNYGIRLLAKNKNIPINIISPTSVKKFAVANGQASKEIILDAWKRLDNRLKNVNIKKDDLADAYFIASYDDHV